MIFLKNFQPYTPEEPPFSGAMYLKSDTGEDWYDCQKSFSEDTLKVAFNSDGIIVSATMDVSSMFPSGLSVAEVKATGMPELSDLIGGGWKYQNGKVAAVVLTPSQEEAVASAQKSLLMSQSTDRIAPLQDAVELDIATEQEKAELNAWKKYRVLLNRVDTSKAPDITWPDQPA